VSLRDLLLERSVVYRGWQAPFAAAKFAPVLEHNDLSRARRVLDVGCGPGTNTAMFAASDYYLGVDLNPKYVADARRRHRREFVVGDAGQLDGRIDGTFDFILVNSLLHHLSDAAAMRTLESLPALLSDNGHVHILDLVRPPQFGVARLLARADRGRYARPLAEWQAMFEAVFEPVVVEPYAFGLWRAPLWRMVYLKGGRRTAGETPS
jgi:SAM-dependent methyltransferase